MKSRSELRDLYKMYYRGADAVTDEFSDVLNSMHGISIDIGCGSGIMTREIILPKLPRDSLVVGVDASESAINDAQKLHGDEEKLSFKTMNMNCTTQLEKHERYDNVLSFYYLHLFQNVKKTMKNISDLLKPGGQGLVLLVSDHYIYDFYMRYRPDHRFEPYMKETYFHYIPHFGCPNAADLLRKDMEINGLEVLHCSHRQMKCAYDNLQSLQNFLLEIDPFVDQMPNDIKNKYKKKMTKRLNENTFKDKNNCVIDTYKVLVAHFKKPHHIIS